MIKSNSTLHFLLIAALLVASTVSCSDDDNAGPGNLVQVASSDPQFSTLVAAVQKANLAGVLSSGTYTVFAPTNAAFNALLADLGASSLDDISAEALTPILLNHVVAGSVKSTDLVEGYVASANANGPNDLPIDLYITLTGGVKINKDISVTKADVPASNGVIHVIDKVILPTDVVDIALTNSNFTSLVGALGAAEGDLVSVLQGDGPFTVFAPVNSAFEEIADVTDDLSASELADVLKYHVVSGNVLSSALTNGMTVNTLSGTFTVNISGSSVTLTDESGSTVNVIATDVQGTNGVVHVIDKVLLK